ncbi:flagellar basal body rod protein FlgB [Limnobacter humi]|uniref:Flagellar basal body rod protein FlgB n=1 Tax=Limnobacter humi TaxID=1778671 RepID=A0ABT1WJD7_9BURK|nr:flagellar basal body rod protein FlgB [Limnobacter humi]MCQ8897539.1 flagellar basal body rod protein FlgB [Limnobacter humi]
MVDKIREAMGTYADALKLRATRQEVIAGNMANADTPNYKSVDFDFSQALRQAKTGGKSGSTINTAATHPAHLVKKGKGVNGSDLLLKFREVEKKSLDNNTVDMDIERAAFSENTVKYEAASQSLSGLVRTMRSAITGN